MGLLLAVAQAPGVVPDVSLQLGVHTAPHLKHDHSLNTAATRKGNYSTRTVMNRYCTMCCPDGPLKSSHFYHNL